MELAEIIESLTTGEAAIPQVRFTIPEGRTIRQIANALDESGKFDFNEEEFLAEAMNIEKYQERFPDLKAIPRERLESEEDIYPLE